MRWKLVSGSASITRMLYTRTLCFRAFHKCSRLTFSKSKQVPYVNNSHLRFQIYTIQQLDLLVRSAKSIATPVEEYIFSKLKELMKNGLLRKKDVDEALVNKASYGDFNNSLLILQCISKLPDISPKNRIALAEEFLSKVKSVSGVVTEDHCLQVLECYLQSKYFENLHSFLSVMKDYGVNHSREIQLLVLKCFTVKGLEKENLALTKKFEIGNFEKTEEFYAAKIYNLAVSGGINKALEEIKQIKGNNIDIGSKIYTSLLKAVALKGNLCEFEELTRDVLLEGKIFSNDQILDILENVVLSKNYGFISEVKLLCADEVFFKASQILLIKLIHSDKIESAYTFMNSLFGLNFACESGDKESFFNTMFKSFIEESCKINFSLIDLIEKCKQLKKLKKSFHCVEHVLYCCLMKADIKGSLLVLQAMFNDNIPIEAHYFWPLFITIKEKFGDEGIIFILDKMAELKVPFTPETLMEYVFPNMSGLHFAKDIVERVDLTEAQNELLIEVFVLYTIKKRLFKDGLEFMAVYPLRQDKSYKFLENDLMKALLDNPRSEDIVLLAKETDAVDPFSVIAKMWSSKNETEIRQLSNCFKKHKMLTKKVDEAKAFIKLNENQPFIKKAVSMLIDENAINRKTDSDFLETKKSSRYEELMALENTEVILAELNAKNMNTTGQRLRLVKMYMWNQFYDKAVKAVKEALTLLGTNADFSPGYLIILARLSAYDGDADNAMRYFNTLKEKYPYFTVGSITGLSLCFHLMENNHYKDMLNILRTLPKWEGKVEDISLKSVQLLREVAKSGMPELTDIVFKIMLQKKYITVDVNSLQVYTKSYLYANNLDGAVNEYERIAQEHGVICNTTSILWSLVQLDRFDLVNRLTRIFFEKVKTEVPLVATLTIIASKGDVKFLLSYSERFGFPLDHDLMIRKFNEGKVPSCPNKAFETLIAAALMKKLPYGHFVQGAVKKIIKEKNYQGAEDLLNFCKSNKIRLSRDLYTKLTVHSQLGEISAASAIGNEKKLQKNIKD